MHIAIAEIVAQDVDDVGGSPRRLGRRDRSQPSNDEGRENQPCVFQHEGRDLRRGEAAGTQVGVSGRSHVVSEQIRGAPSCSGMVMEGRVVGVAAGEQIGQQVENLFFVQAVQQAGRHEGER